MALKGKRDPVPLVAVAWDGAPVEAPAAAPVETPPPVDARLAARSGDADAARSIFVLDLGLGPRGLRVAAVDGPGDKGPVRAYAEPGLDLAGLDALAGRFAAYLDGDADAGTYADGLEAAGRELFDTALSDRARRHLRETGCHYLRLHLDDALAHLPWELAHDGTACLGRRFAVGRVVETRSDEGEGSVIAYRPGTGHALVVSDPTGDLPEARREGEAVAGLYREGFGGEVRHLAGPVTREALLAALPGCRILHFAGHVIRGGADADGGFQLADGLLPASAIAQAVGSAPPELVFANGCHGGGDRAFTEGARRAGSVAASLLLGGVGHFLGPLGRVPDADALVLRPALPRGDPRRPALRRGGAPGPGGPPGRPAPRLRPLPLLRRAAQRPRSGPGPAPGRGHPVVPAPGDPRGGHRRDGGGGPGGPGDPGAQGDGPPDRGGPGDRRGGGGGGAVAHPAPGHPEARGATGAHREAGPAPGPGEAGAPAAEGRPPHRPGDRRRPPLQEPHRHPTLQPLAEGLTESVITGFAGAQGIHLVEHVQIGADVHYQEWTHSKYVDPATRARIGKIVGCEVVVLGGYQKAGHVLRATARLVRVDTGEILAAVEVERPQAKVFALQDAVAKALRGDLPAVEKVMRP